RRDGQGALHLGDAEVGDADVAHLPLALEARQFRPALLNVFLWFGPVDLVEIDHIDLQATQTAFALAPNRLRLKACDDGSVRVPHPLALGENIRTRRTSLKCARHHLFGMTESVKRGSVQPVEAVIQGGVNGGDRIAIVLRAHATVPTAASDGPGADSGGGEVEIAVSKLSRLHPIPS